MVGGVMLTALLFELLDAKSGDIKTWVKGKLKDTRFINKINTTVENTITKVFSKADQFALLSGKVEKELGSTEIKLSEAHIKKLLEGLKDGKSVDNMVAEQKNLCESGGKYTESQIKDILNNLKGDGFKNNPLRQAYENEVRALKEYGEQLLADGMSEEQVAQILNLLIK